MWTVFTFEQKFHFLAFPLVLDHSLFTSIFLSQSPGDSKTKKSMCLCFGTALGCSLCDRGTGLLLLCFLPLVVCDINMLLFFACRFGWTMLTCEKLFFDWKPGYTDKWSKFPFCGQFYCGGFNNPSRRFVIQAWLSLCYFSHPLPSCCHLLSFSHPPLHWVRSDSNIMGKKLHLNFLGNCF